MLDREHLDLLEAGLGGVAAHRVGPHDRARAGRGGVREADREAAEDAVRVHEALDLVPGGGERVGDALVHDEHGPVVRDQAAQGAQHVDRPGHVVEGLEDRDELVGAGQLGVAGVPMLERDAVLDAGPREVRLCELHGGLVEVEPVHDDLGVRTGDGDARPAGAARDVGDARGRVGDQPLVDIVDRRQPFGAEEVGEHRPVRVGLGLTAQLAVVLPGHPAAAAERLLDGREDVREGHAVAGQRRHVRQRVAVGEDLRVTRGQAETPRGGVGARVVDLEDPGDGLLLEPLAGVALVGAGRGGELRGRG